MPALRNSVRLVKNINEAHFGYISPVYFLRIVQSVHEVGFCKIKQTKSSDSAGNKAKGFQQRIRLGKR